MDAACHRFGHLEHGHGHLLGNVDNLVIASVRGILIIESRKENKIKHAEIIKGHKKLYSL